MDQKEGGTIVGDVVIKRYMVIHEPSEVLVSTLASSRAMAVSSVKDQAQGSGFEFPDGKWVCIGDSTVEEMDNGS